MRVFLTGATGQVGRALCETAADDIEIIAPDRTKFDLTNHDQIGASVVAARPDVVINAAAYTAVDHAEANEPLARAVNVDAVAHMARAAEACGAQIVHLSTDFVFDGCNPLPYSVDAEPHPLSVYGQSKREGELAAQAAHPNALIVRTAWVYAAHGRNFVRTMLRLMRERDEVRVVSDQIGTPTHATSFARALWRLIGASATDIHHFTDAGVASWYDFAVAIGDLGHRQGLLPRRPLIVPIATADFPTTARRPPCVVLDKSMTWPVCGLPRHWHDELAEMLDREKEAHG